MTISLDQLKSAFDKTNKQEQNTGFGNYYRFWDMKFDETAVIRFLPDRNSENPLGFMVEKLSHSLTINGERKNVPCLKMYDEDCPVCKVSSSFYKEDNKTEGKKYWRTKQHIAQALIIEDPLAADETGENAEGKVKVINLSYQLFNVIKEALQSGELDEVPFSYENGYNFIIKKTKQGDYPSYAVGSRFKSKASSLSTEDVEVLMEDLVDLSTLLPKHPGEDKVSAMLQAALTGGAYTNEDTDSTDDAVSEDTVVSTSVSSVTVSSAKADPVSDEVDDQADAILAKIRERRAAKGGN